MMGMALEEDVAEGVAKSMTEDLGESAFKDAEESTKFEAELSKALQGTADELKEFMAKNKSIIGEDSAKFQEKLDSVVKEQQATLGRVAKAEKGADEAFADAGKGVQPEGVPDAGEPRELTPEEKAEALKQANIERKAQDIAKKMKDKLKTDVSAKAKEIQNQYADRMERFKTNPTGVSKDYSLDLDGLVKDQNALRRIDSAVDKDGKKLFDVDVTKLQNDLAHGTEAERAAACQEVAKMKALEDVGNLQKIIAGSGAKVEEMTAMLDKTIGDVSASFDDLEKEMKDPDFFKETTEREAGGVEHGAKGEVHPTEGREIKTSKFQKWLDKTEKDLNSSIDEQANKIIKDCDLSADKLEKDAGMGKWGKRAGKIKRFFGNRADSIAELKDSLGTDLRTTTKNDLQDKASSVVDGIGGGLKSIGRKLEGMAEMLVSAVLFMIPNIFQSTFLAQQAKAAAMASWGNPIKFGGKVYQIPDSCINLENPTSSWPIYVEIPVENVGDEIPADVAALFNGSISGPTTNNALARAIHSASSEIFSFGMTHDTTISRYKMDESTFLPLTDIVVVYGGPNGYVTPGSIAMNSSQFTTGQVISLRTGMVTDATGDVVNATGFESVKGVPLIPVTQWGALSASNTSPVGEGLQAVHQFLASILAKGEVAGSKDTYTQYSNISSGSEGQNLSAVVQDLLDADCVRSDGSLKVADCPCVIVDGLESQSAGVTINAAGDVSTVFHVNAPTPQQFLDVKASSAPVIPVASGTIIDTKATKNKVLGRLSVTSSSSIPATVPTSVAVAPTSTSSTSTPATAPTSTAVAPTSGGWNGLGAVIPIFGWGTSERYNSIITPTAFPGFNPSTAGVTGVERVGSIAGDNLVTAGTGATGEASMVFASEDNVWVAQGCWIYLCTNTPFAQYIRQGVTISPSLTGSYVDYIVFMDADLNIIPLMAPVTVDIEVDSSGTSYKKAQMYLNPAIKFWTSLIAYGLPDFVQEGHPIMYNLQGNIYSEPSLKDIIPAFVYSSQNGSGIQGGFPEIYNQFEVHKAALIARLGNMPIPYANCALSTGAANTLTIGTNPLTTYTGLNCWESSVGGDYLIPLNVYPMSKNPQPQTLPNPDAVYLASMVTDIVYELQNNAWVPYDFTYSMLQLDGNNHPIKTAAGSYEVNASLETQFYFMSGFYSAATPPATLVADLTKKRTAWLKNMGVTTQLGSGSSAITCSLAAGLSQKSVQVTGFYIYQLNPSPSATMVSGQDYFVAVATAAPALTSLKPISILKAASANGTLVSLLTGTLYDMTGTPITHQNGLPKRIAISSAALAGGKTSAQVIYNQLTKMFTNLPAEFTAAYQAAVQEYSVTQAQPQGPYPFGQQQVAIRSGDLANGTYVYFSAGGMHKTDFKPRDLYVILTPAASGTGYSVSQYDATQTQYLLSLITGVAYDQNGQLSMTLPPADLQSMITKWSVGWSPWIKTTLQEMQAAYTARQARYATDEERVEKQLDEFAQKHDAAENKQQDTIAAIIARLQPAGSGLPDPFPALQYDATTKQYVHPSPAGVSPDSGLIYLFMSSGEVYSQDGTYRSTYQPAHLQAVRDQYGVVVDLKTGQQKLGIPMMQPSLLLPVADQTVTIGKSGESMIASTDVNFPGGPVLMKKGYGLFFSKIMDTYYAFDSATSMWMSIDGGHLYEPTGAPIIRSYDVAIAGPNDLMLLYKVNGLPQAFMSDGSDYANLSSSDTNMQWMGQSDPYTELTVIADKKQIKYTVGKKTYTVKDTYAWHSLLLVPIDDEGVLLSEIPDTSYQFVQLVLHGKDVTNVLYHGVMYKVHSVAANSYTMIPVDAASDAPTIMVTTELVDMATTAPYIEIIDGKNTYKYAYESLSDDQDMQEANRVEIWKGVTTPSPLPLAVGPMHKKSVKIAGQTLDLSLPDHVTHTAFVRDLPSKKDTITSPVAVSAKLVQDAPSAQTNPTGYDTFQLGLQNIVMTKDNRFLCSIGGWTATPAAGVMTFPYVSMACYVDLATGALFDTVSGLATGQSLNMKDFLTVLDNCAVVVSKNAKGNNILVYRNANVSRQQAATIEAESQVTPAGTGNVVVKQPQPAIAG